MSRPTKIMLIRHAERPAKVGAPYGTNPNGDRDVNSLSTVGWQRAGALVTLFDPAKRSPRDSRLGVPTNLFATDIGHGSESKREQQTIKPLASKLGLALDAKYLKQDHEQVANDVLSSNGVVLICWDHKFIPAVANGILGNTTTVPQKWKRKRFDLVWVFGWEPSTASYSFTQVPQELLPGDSTKVIKPKHST
jgi:hypothetical protein